MIRDNHQREMLFDMDQTIQSLIVLHGSNDAHVVKLSGIYHNLVRQWAEV